MKPDDEVFEDLDISNNNYNELPEITSDSEDSQQDVIQTHKKKQNARERNRRYQDKVLFLIVCFLLLLLFSEVISHIPPQCDYPWHAKTLSQLNLGLDRFDEFLSPG